MSIDIQCPNFDSVFKLSIGTWCVTIQRSTPDTQDIARMYDDASKRWQPIMKILGCSRSYIALFKQLKNDGWLDHLHGGAKILDCGIGTAEFSIALAKSIHGNLNIHGIDIAPRMLAQARNNLSHFEREGLTMELHCSDVGSLTYSADEFDVVMSAHMLEHNPNPSETIREMARVLKSGSPLLIVTTCIDQISSLHSLRWRYRPIESLQLLQWMRDAGLRDVKKYPLDNNSIIPSPMSEAYIGRKD
jgi:ubiquinone/menaquinone biosynthesis C-methylase UbiE